MKVIKHVFVFLLVLVLIISTAFFYNEHKDKETRYQEGIAYIQQGDWENASLKLVMLTPSPLDHSGSYYKYSKELYTYAVAREDFQKEYYEMAWNQIKDIGFDYDGPFEKDIWNFQKEAKAKYEGLTHEQKEYEQEAFEQEIKQKRDDVQKYLDDYKNSK